MKGTRVSASRASAKDSATTEDTTEVKTPAKKTARTKKAAGAADAVSAPAEEKKSAAKMTFAAGDTVDHKTFGRGKVTKVGGDTLFVKFSKTGQTKKLLKDYAPIVKIG